MTQVVKNPPANAGDPRHLGSVPESGRSTGGENGNPLQNSCLGNPADRGAWWTTVHGVERVGYDGAHMSILLLLLSRSVVSDSLQPCGLQHAKVPCPLPSPGACSNSGPLNQ